MPSGQLTDLQYVCICSCKISTQHGCRQAYGCSHIHTCVCMHVVARVCFINLGTTSSSTQEKKLKDTANRPLYVRQNADAEIHPKWTTDGQAPLHKHPPKEEYPLLQKLPLQFHLNFPNKKSTKMHPIWFFCEFLYMYPLMPSKPSD